MRPVNLIPPEQRSGDRAPLRSGGASYLVVGALVVALAAVSAIVLTNNQIADRESEKASLQAQEAELKERAEGLAPYAQFATMQQARRQTVASLAQSRFDWERVLRELAIVIPDDVWLVQLTGTVTPEVQLDDSADLSLRGQVTGPALEIIGCAASQDSVARFVAALRDVDGITRVALSQSKRPDVQASAGGAEPSPTDSSSTDGADCRTRDFIARFEIVAAFDAVPTATAAVPPAAAPAPATAPTTDAASTSAADGDVADAQQQEQAARDSSSEQTETASKATDLVTGAVR